jgi:hypothetical protein
VGKRFRSSSRRGQSEDPRSFFVPSTRDDTIELAFASMRSHDDRLRIYFALHPFIQAELRPEEAQEIEKMVRPFLTVLSQVFLRIGGLKFEDAPTFHIELLDDLDKRP